MPKDIGTTYLYGTGLGTAGKLGPNRESVMDMVVNIDPFDTPFHNLAPKVPAKHTTEEWLVDTLSATSTAGLTEGSPFAQNDLASPSRVVNITQIFGKYLMVSETQQAVSPYGFSDTFLYEVMKGTREVMRNIEKRIFTVSGGSAAGTMVNPTGGTARAMKTLDDFIQTNRYHVDSTALGRGGTTASVASLSEVVFNRLLELVYIQGGNPGWCFAHPTFKRKLSNQIGGAALGTGGTTITLNMNASERAIVRSINTYLSDFGIINIVTDRWCSISTNAAGDTNNLAGILHFLELPRCQIAYLRPLRFRQLAADGDRVRGMVIGELTLKVLAEKACGSLVGIDER